MTHQGFAVVNGKELFSVNDLEEEMNRVSKPGIVIWHSGTGEDSLTLASIGGNELVMIKGDRPPGSGRIEIGSSYLIDVTATGTNLIGNWAIEDGTDK